MLEVVIQLYSCSHSFASAVDAASVRSSLTVSSVGDSAAFGRKVL